MKQRCKSHRGKVQVIWNMLRATGLTRSRREFIEAYLRHVVVPHPPEDGGMGRKDVAVDREGPPTHDEGHICEVAGTIQLLHALHKRGLACICNGHTSGHRETAVISK